MQARVLYDFDGDTENGELVIKEGEVITVHNQVGACVGGDMMCVYMGRGFEPWGVALNHGAWL